MNYGELARRRGPGGERVPRTAFMVRDLARGARVGGAEQAIGVQETAEEPSHGPGKLLDERGGGDDLVVARQLGLLIDVDHLQLVVILQLRFAELINTPDGLARSGSGSSHIESQEIFSLGSGRQGPRKARVVVRTALLAFREVPVQSAAGCRSNPTSTCSVSERLPMMVRTGLGSLRTTVGVARIWSPLASQGCFSKVDHRDAIAAFEVGFADPLQVRERRDRFGRPVHHIKTQLRRPSGGPAPRRRGQRVISGTRFAFIIGATLPFRGAVPCSGRRPGYRRPDARRPSSVRSVVSRRKSRVPTCSSICRSSSAPRHRVRTAAR